jgi:hypothetical protein
MTLSACKGYCVVLRAHAPDTSSAQGRARTVACVRYPTTSVPFCLGPISTYTIHA